MAARCVLFGKCIPLQNQLFCNSFSSTLNLQKKIKRPPKHVSWHKRVSNYEVGRIEAGKSRTGSEYGVLTDKLDWSFADGRPGFPGSGQIRRKAEQCNIAREICDIYAELTDIQRIATTQHQNGMLVSHCNSQQQQQQHSSTGDLFEKKANSADEEIHAKMHTTP